MIFSGIPVQIIIAFIVDSLIGDPRSIPHPVRYIGLLISRLEFLLRRYTDKVFSERLAGVIVVLVVVPATCIATRLLLSALHSIAHISLLSFISLEDLLIGIAGSFAIALKGLRDSSTEVLDCIGSSDHITARKRLSRIVGRDTETLDEEGVLRATIETLAENASDGVIAPLFYFAFGGLPLAMAYKAINTLDSMLGYRDKRYINFGYASARLDDLANYIPARLTALLILASVALLKILQVSPQLSIRGSVRILSRDGRKHTSPNAGMPEAAVAGALGIKLGGPSVYEGIECNKPSIGEHSRAVSLSDGKTTGLIVVTTGMLGMLLCTVISLGINHLTGAVLIFW